MDNGTTTLTPQPSSRFPIHIWGMKPTVTGSLSGAPHEGNVFAASLGCYPVCPHSKSANGCVWERCGLRLLVGGG